MNFVANAVGARLHCPTAYSLKRPSAFWLLRPEVERGLETRAHRRIAAIRIPRTIQRVEVRQRQDALHDPGVVRLVVLQVSPHRNVDEPSARTAERNAVRDAMEVREVVRQIQLVVAKIRRRELRQIRRLHLPLRRANDAQRQDQETLSNDEFARAGSVAGVLLDRRIDVDLVLRNRRPDVRRLPPDLGDGDRRR